MTSMLGLDLSIILFLGGELFTYWDMNSLIKALFFVSLTLCRKQYLIEIKDEKQVDGLHSSVVPLYSGGSPGNHSRDYGVHDCSGILLYCKTRNSRQSIEKDSCYFE